MKSFLILIAALGLLDSLQLSPRAEAAETVNASHRSMTRNKQTVQKYMEGFRNTDHEAVLSCLTEDVEWVIPGMFQVRGKQAFDKEIENPEFIGKPIIQVTRLIEEGEVVVAEGTVRARRKSGEVTEMVFCDVFEMQDGKVKRLISYLMPAKPDTK